MPVNDGVVIGNAVAADGLVTGVAVAAADVLVAGGAITDGLLQRPDLAASLERPSDIGALRERLQKSGLRATVDEKRLFESIQRFKPLASARFSKLPQERRESIAALKPEVKRFHGAKVNLG